MKRLLSMDILRGIIILMMVIFHVFLNTSSLFVTALEIKDLTVPEMISTIGIGPLLLLGFFNIFIHWQSLILMISALVHWYTMEKLLQKGQKIGNIFIKQIVAGLGIYLLGFLIQPILSYMGMMAGWFNDGGIRLNARWPWELWTSIYHSNTLSNIGFCIMLSSIIFVGLARYRTSKHNERTQIFFKIVWLVAIATLFILLSPIVHNVVNNFVGVNLQKVGQTTDYVSSELDYHAGYYTRWFFNSVAGSGFPIFPQFGYFLVGSIFGVLLSQSNPPRKILKHASLIGLMIFIAGILWWFFVDEHAFGFRVHPTGYVIFSIGIQIQVICLALRLYEFNPKMHTEKRRKNSIKYSKWIRRWGMFSLSIFVFSIAEILPRAFLTYIIPDVDFQQLNLTSLPWTLLCIGLTILMWEGIMRLFEKIRGYGSVEWIFSVMFKAGKKKNKKDPLGIQGILNDIEPVIFVPAE